MAKIKSLEKLVSVLRYAIEECHNYVNNDVEVDVTEEQLEWLLEKVKSFQEKTPEDDDVEVIVKYIASPSGRHIINGVEVAHYNRRSVGVGVVT